MDEGDRLREILDRQIDQHTLETNYAIAIKQLLTTYPDLKRHKSRWGEERYCSPMFNTSVTDCEITHACGCCPDSAIYVWPYLEKDGHRLYAYPIPFHVGEANYGNGENSLDNWEDKLRSAHIPDHIIQKVQRFFVDNTPYYVPAEKFAQ
jgi:hypothetical protein